MFLLSRSLRHAHRYVLHLTPTQTMPLYLHVVGGDRVNGSGTLTVTVSRDGS